MLFSEGAAVTDLAFAYREQRNEIHASFRYNTDLFDPETIKRMAGHFRQLLESITLNPELPVSQLQLLSEVELRFLLRDCNDTAKQVPSLCLHQLFEQQVERTPDAVALVYQEEQLTYAELNTRANRLAHHLRSLGVGAESLVGILMERSLEMVISLLAVLKAGGAYLPLDPAYPAERLRFMIDDAGVRVLLTKAGEPERVRAEEMVKVGERCECGCEQRDRNPDAVVDAENLAYVIYTSGSTGIPKGVMVAHQGLSNLSASQVSTFVLSSESHILQFSSLSFDASIFEIAMALLAGASLHLGERESLIPDSAMVELMRKNSITHITLPPSVLSVLPRESLPALRVMIVAGEACPAELVKHWRDDRRLFNAYGPTEATVWSTVEECRDDGQKPLIGRPIANAQIFILDDELQPVPLGVTGEIHISSIGLARGYLGRAELTAEKFVPHPFSAEPGMRLYKSGDLGKYHLDGRIEYVGRRDEQVKVRGHRIELGEIEAVLRRHERVRESVLVVDESVAGGRLVAYIVGAGDEAPAGRELRAYLKERLPEYMIPAMFVTVAELPLLPNGKLDRKALPAVDLTGEVASGFDAVPLNPTEELLCSIFCATLKLERLSIHDNFFDLGGHSLLAAQLVTTIRHSFKVELPLRAIFESPTVAALATLVERLRSETGGSPPALPLEARHHTSAVPLSFAQERLWFMDQLTHGTAAYTISAAVRFEGSLNVDHLRDSLREVTRRHEVMRTRIRVVDGQPVQEVLESDFEVLELIELSGEERLTAAARELADEEAHSGFELGEGKLWRAKLVRLSDNDQVLLLTMHHIISDGWSTRILFQELAHLYNSKCRGEISNLPELPVQYADYTLWQRERLQGTALADQLSFWKRQLEGAPAVLELPADRPRPAVLGQEGGSENFVVPQELFKSLTKLSHREGVTPFMTLFAAFLILLYRYSGEVDLVVGTPIANRNRAETEHLIGLFVNTLVLRTSLAGEPTFCELLRRVREVALDAYAHQDVPFERLVEELQPVRSLSHNPLFQIGLAWGHTPAEATDFFGLKRRPLKVEAKTAKFDLELYLDERPEQLNGVFVYNRGLFDRSTIARMTGHLLTLLRGIAAHPQQRISELPLLSESEQRQLLTEGKNTRSYDLATRVIHRWFEERAEQLPGAVALNYQGRQMTYGELNRRANRLAHYLRKLGAGPETLVGLCLERSLETVIGLLGVLKAGAAYLPLDPVYPAERLSFMLEDAAVTILLTQQSLAGALPSSAARIVCMDLEREQIDGESAENPATGVLPENLAYVIYTSGSTGVPKGVQIRHDAVCNVIKASVEGFGIGQGKRVLQLASLSFDASVLEIFTALLSGATLHLVNREMAVAGPALARFIRRERIGVMALPPSLLDAIPDGDYPNLGVIIVGGEACSAETYARWSVGRRFFNAYAPTETTIYTAVLECLGDYEQGPPLGRPIAGTEIYILDKQRQIVPHRVTGEIYLGGAGLARGYLNRPDITAERFVPHPFSTEPGARLYKTGDMARYLEDGNIEFVGRVDGQVKIRGFRIELGEIEAALSRHERVRECVVVARDDDAGEKRLVGYIVDGEGEPLSTGELREHLKHQLPEYMIPTAFIMLDELPLTHNGKVARESLPAPDHARPELDSVYVAPQTEVEKLIADVWQDVLKIERVGTHDNFFDLGGHSLLVVQVQRRLQETFNQELPITEMFKYPTISALSNRLYQERDAHHWSEKSQSRAATRHKLLVRQKPPRSRVQFGRSSHEVVDD
jgi:amino acid adenylation domain-containing protein